MPSCIVSLAAQSTDASAWRLHLMTAAPALALNPQLLCNAVRPMHFSAEGGVLLWQHFAVPFTVSCLVSQSALASSLVPHGGQRRKQPSTPLSVMLDRSMQRR